MARFTIGRDDTNDIIISDKSVSRQHAELYDLGDDVYKLVDSGSSNGTWCLGDAGWKPVISAELEADSMVKLGDYSTSVAALLMEADARVTRRASDDETKQDTRRR